MAQSYGKAGNHVKNIGKRKIYIKYIFILISIIVSYIFYKIYITIPSTNFYLKTVKNVFGAFSIGSLLSIFIPLFDDKLDIKIKNAFNGAKGEQEIAELLEALPDEYVVFNNIFYENRKIDHIVIGPTGVYLIETISSRGKVEIKNDKILINGYQYKTLGRMFSNVFWLKNFLGVDFVKGIVVFTKAFVPLDSEIKNIMIVNKKYLVDKIINEKQYMDKDTIEYLKNKVLILIRVSKVFFSSNYTCKTLNIY
ncbi:nuclease-related domain-containing protein [Thermoanaerobacterium thermosaccharolyticum]|uniref:nuclease-related domain-containing protein n=1 Tax=Thermoanaerobacterium thermosaccharolyticum TaxID=1517 RepID=UPI001783DAEB|nr:nuclease-related domain-containing protein [Thermoanaerobacterium thermosaccharolyticum]MBE0069209.1 NERD domain-containing protein [Thermoanaerobacterium thermosaccharolyticum]MBE0228119.1 NERD domain-containing protein [Thermoanaerobacterium thermosaccharolyticum]